MFKRIISCLLLVMMLIPVISPVFATNANNELQVNRNKVSSVDSILSEYHANVFAAKVSANANGRSVAEVQTDTIKQDTLNQLRDAGYHAYDVNSNTFDSVAEELKTDLSKILDPNGSYIIVISGEEEPQTNASSQKYIPLRNSDDLEAFYYTYNGTVYRMRYMTVVNAPVSLFAPSGSANLNLDAIIHGIDSSITISSDYMDTFSIGTLASLLDTSYNDACADSTGSLYYYTQAEWIRRYIQVWGSYAEDWTTNTRVERAEVRSYCSGYLCNLSNGNLQWYEGDIKTNNVYSLYYHDYEQQKIEAVLGYLNLSTLRLFTTGTLVIKHEGNTLFRFSIPLLDTHVEEWPDD